MINSIMAIIKLLKHNIFLEDNVVPVIKRYYPYDNSPCITFDDSAGGTLFYRQVITLNLPLDSDHPRFDSSNPSKCFPQQVLKEKKSSDLRLNIWADTEEDKDKITNQVKEIFNKALSNHYTTCYFYKEGTCSKCNTKCEAIDNITGRGIKKQCPKPKTYGYINILSYYNILKRTFKVSPEYSIDDLNTKQTTLRTIIPITMNYHTYHKIGGNPTEEIKIQDIGE